MIRRRDVTEESNSSVTGDLTVLAKSNSGVTGDLTVLAKSNSDVTGGSDRLSRVQLGRDWGI